MSGKKNITKYFLLLFLKQLTLGQPLGHNRALSLKELQIMLEQETIVSWLESVTKRKLMIEKLWFVCKFKRTNSMIFVRHKRFHFMTALFKNTILKQFSIPGRSLLSFLVRQYTICDTAISELMFLCDTKTRLFWTYILLKLPWIWNAVKEWSLTK